ncbi:hypothetical protein ACIA8O_15175 [Kitasatospora sp. NPDC051853]|uniref:hypothetical protein n=1 Tax=Kitasatospora sp. NPDC051853 TaxID=3364058 RepID=UPI00379DB924
MQLCMFVLHHRMGRLRAARAAGDRGAISIELALAVVVLVGIAGAIVVAVSTLGKTVKGKIPADQVVPSP